LNRTWLLYWGLQAGLSCCEAVTRTVGEILGLMACHAIQHGLARQKTEMSIDEMLMLE
jgi:hypothetical protein